MKIVFFTDTFWPNVDGVASTTTQIAGELSRTGNSVWVVTLGEKEKVMQKDEINIIYLKGKKLDLYPDYKISIFPKLKKIEKLINFNKVDIIHAQTHISMGFAAYTFSRRYNIPLVATFHTLLPDFINEVIKKKFEAIKSSKLKRILKKSKILDLFTKFVSLMGYKWISSYYKLSDLVIVPSDFSKELLEKKGVSNITRIYNGLVNDKGETYSKLKEKYKVKKEEFILLHVGRVSYEKRIDIIIKAFKIADIQNSKLIITSKGPALDDLKNLVKKENLTDKVIFTGYVERKELVALYDVCDIFVSPSLFENFSVAAAEATLHGKPLICAYSGGHKEVVREGFNGFSVKHTKNEKKEIKEYAEKIKKLYNNPKLLKKMGENSKKFSNNIKFEKTFNEYLKIYKDLLKKPKQEIKQRKIKTLSEYIFLNFFLTLPGYFAKDPSKLGSKIKKILSIKR